MVGSLTTKVFEKLVKLQDIYTVPFESFRLNSTLYMYTLYDISIAIVENLE